MARFLHSPALQHPERIHPLLWRGSQLAYSYQKTVSSGYQKLDAQLPGQGWPTGTLIEIMSARPGIGEMQLLKPALVNLQNNHSIILINPPYTPSALYLEQWFAKHHRILWLKSNTARNTLWAAEKILQHNTCAALLCWVDNAHPASIHRLHLAARQSHTLLFSLRPASAAAHSSVAPLRISLEPHIWGLNINVLKRRGPLLKTAIPLHLRKPETDRFVPHSSDKPKHKDSGFTVPGRETCSSAVWQPGLGAPLALGT